MNLNPGDIVLIEIQFHQTPGAKIRPAVVVLHSGDADFVAAPITSRPRASKFDLVLADWQVAGLSVPAAAAGGGISPFAVRRVRNRRTSTTVLFFFLSDQPFGRFPFGARAISPKTDAEHKMNP